MMVTVPDSWYRALHMATKKVCRHDGVCFTGRQTIHGLNECMMWCQADMRHKSFIKTEVPEGGTVKENWFRWEDPLRRWHLHRCTEGPRNTELVGKALQREGRPRGREQFGMLGEKSERLGWGCWNRGRGGEGDEERGKDRVGPSW